MAVDNECRVFKEGRLPGRLVDSTATSDGLSRCRLFARVLNAIVQQFYRRECDARSRPAKIEEKE